MPVKKRIFSKQILRFFKNSAKDAVNKTGMSSMRGYHHVS